MLSSQSLTRSSMHFNDCYLINRPLAYSTALLKPLIKTTWKGRSPSDVLFYMDYALRSWQEAAFSIVETYDHKNEVILDHNKIENIWSLAQYHTWCGRHCSPPGTFFPDHLSKKEFLDPYRALRKVYRLPVAPCLERNIKGYFISRLCHHR